MSKTSEQIDRIRKIASLFAQGGAGRDSVEIELRNAADTIEELPAKEMRFYAEI